MACAGRLGVAGTHLPLDEPLLVEEAPPRLEIAFKRSNQERVNLQLVN